MLNNLLYIVWDFDPVMFSIGGLELRYYGLMWAITFLLGERFFSNYAKREGFGKEIVDVGFIWIVLGAILGARVGHCLFYEFPYYITKPWAIITEFRNGGMASHGSALGMLLGMWITCRKVKMPYIWWLDRIMIPVTIGGALVRFGNLCNSEIFGEATTLPWGFEFVRSSKWLNEYAPAAVHPTQIYEALCYLLDFVVVAWMYYGRDLARRRPGLIFGVGLLGIFLSRFVLELIKTEQEAFEVGMTLNMGQWLSIPFILLSCGVIYWAMKRPEQPIQVEKGPRMTPKVKTKKR